MGDFAVNVAVAYQIGAARGDLSILSAMDVHDQELFATLGHAINDLIVSHRKDLEKKRETRSIALNLNASWLEATSTAAGPKRRWVDGTPEYSFHICGLRKLFPNALFIHLFRDVRSVVDSMLNFHRISGTQLVANEQEAYRYWIRTVSSCIKAGRAYGPSVVYRVRYADLINNSESTMRSLLNFLQEPYVERCLEPLKLRINSSTVPADFKINEAATDPVMVKEATQLSDEIESTLQSAEALSAAADELEADFRKRVKYVATMDRSYQEAQRLIETLNKSAP